MDLGGESLLQFGNLRDRDATSAGDRKRIPAERWFLQNKRDTSPSRGEGGGCIFSARPTTHSVRHGQQQKNGWNQSINDTGRAYNEAGKEPAPSIVATNSSRIRAKMIATKGSISCHLFSLSLDSLMLFMYRLVLYPSHRFGRNTSITASNLSTNPHNGYFNLST